MLHLPGIIFINNYVLIYIIIIINLLIFKFYLFSCDTTTYPSGCAKYSNKFNRECLNCSTLCKTCLSGGVDKCTACSDPLYLYKLDGATEG